VRVTKTSLGLIPSTLTKHKNECELQHVVIEDILLNVRGGVQLKTRADKNQRKVGCEESVRKVVEKKKTMSSNGRARSVEPVHPSDQARPARKDSNSRPTAEAKKEPRVPQWIEA